MNLVKEVDFDEIRDRAELAPRVLVISSTEEEARAAAANVLGEQVDRFVDYRTREQVVSFDPSRHDVVIVWDPGQTGLFEHVRKAAGKGRTANIFFLKSEHEAAEEKLRLEIVMAIPDLAPAMGRWFEPFRLASVKAIIDETSRANAQFAVVSNLPAVLPLLGSVIAASADLIVLTKNQIMMSYKLAAANDRDLADHTGVIRELIPVVGAGFVWRSLAREATSFIPFAAGTIPKAVIAFAGTYAIGRAVDFYYRFGKKPAGHQMREFWEQALELMAHIPLPGRDRSELDRNAIETHGEVREPDGNGAPDR
jgi:uncharacterized protein (DUF697 family)